MVKSITNHNTCNYSIVVNYFNTFTIPKAGTLKTIAALEHANLFGLGMAGEEKRSFITIPPCVDDSSRVSEQVQDGQRRVGDH